MEEQKLMHLNYMKKTEKTKGTHAYQKKMLSNCKTWGGPCVSEHDLEQALLKAHDEDFCVTQESTYYKLTNPSEFSSNRHLFRIRGITNDEKLINLRYILSNEEDMSFHRNQIGQLPTNQDVLR